jgi:hypothetical protein
MCLGIRIPTALSCFGGDKEVTQTVLISTPDQFFARRELHSWLNSSISTYDQWIITLRREEILDRTLFDCGAKRSENRKPLRTHSRSLLHK